MKKDLSSSIFVSSTPAPAEWFTLQQVEKNGRQSLESMVSEIVALDNDLTEWLVLMGGGEIDL